MMKFLSNILFPLIGSIVIFSSCTKVVNHNTDFIGEWSAELTPCTTFISIPESGNARYYKTCDSTYVGSEDSVFIETKGIPQFKNKKKTLKIGKKEWRIDSVPSEVFDSVLLWRMTLDGVSYDRLD